MNLSEEVKELLEVKRYNTLNKEHNRLIHHLNQTGWSHKGDGNFEHPDHPEHKIHVGHTDLNYMTHRTDKGSFNKPFDKAVGHLKTFYK
jgi:hypothetical protein